MRVEETLLIEELDAVVKMVHVLESTADVGKLPAALTSSEKRSQS
jgi:hypothetical protein